MYPTVDSPTIDKGLSPDDEFFGQIIGNESVWNYFKEVLKVDLDGNPRKNIDIGAVEYTDWINRRDI